MTTGTDELSADELAYLESGGKSAFHSEPPAPAPSEGDNPTPPPADGLPAPAPGPEQASGDDDDGDDGALPEGVQIKVDKNGRPRLVGADGKFVKSVPHKAFHSERERRKALQKELETERIMRARGEERLAILNEAFNGSGDPKAAANGQQRPANPLDEPPIDIEKDFVGWAKQQERQKAYLIEQLTKQRQTTEQREQFRSVKEVYHADAQALLQADPNFKDAYMHLVAGRHRELEFMGMTDEKQRNAYIAQEEAALVQQAIQSGQRPAVLVYEMAKARGFTPKAPANPATPGNGTSPALSAAQQKIAHVKNGQQAAQTLSQAGSGASEGLTFQALANMTDEEFARAVDGMSKAQVERFLGR
jgi:hypothetical protein